MAGPDESPHEPRGANRRQPLELAYAEARDGCTRAVDVLREVVCTACDGAGGDGQTCVRCEGKRTITTVRGMLVMGQVCPDCGGTGRYIIEPCDRCERGLRPCADRVEVRVPPGIQNGMALCVAGKGDEHPAGGAPGDLFLVIEVDLMGVLVPCGDHVVIEAAVRGRHVLLGGPLEVGGLDGSVTVQVPRGVRDGDSVRLPGRGNICTGGAADSAPAGDPYRGGSAARGDQIVVFRVPPEAERARRVATGLAAGVLAALGWGTWLLLG
jgi:molecular chaperone DnaJ